MVAAIDDALEELATRTGAAPASSTVGEPLSNRMAEALGWRVGTARLEPMLTYGDLKLTRGFLGPQPAAVFAADGAVASRQLLRDAALFAYHTSVHWGVVADSDGAVIFNSHWVRDEEWFRLPPITWSELEEHVDLLTAISPEGVTAGRLDRLASSISAPDRILTPVDDALVARLDYWRQTALRHGREANGDLDQDLHTLFAQLFVLRTVEDRRLAPEIPRLESAVRGEEQVDREALSVVFAQARNVIQSRLFSDDPLGRFPGFVLAGIIRDLYVPTQLPQGSQRYNFAWIDADVLGRAYEKYLANVFRPAPPPPQLRLFEQPAREIEPLSVKKLGGVFYTPNYLVGTLTEQAVERVLAEHTAPEFIPRIVDFACGSGSFLVEAVGLLIRRLRARDPQRNWARTLIEGRHVVGIDVDPRAVTLSRMNLWIRFTEEPDPLPLPSIDEVVVVGDSLGEDVWKNLPETYDVVLGNPPFIATLTVRPPDDLAKRFQTARGRFDYSSLFVELRVRRLAPGGILGMVVPNRLFRNRTAGLVREILTTQADLLAVIDFGANEVFKETSAYIGAVIAQRRESADETRPAHVRVVIVSDVTDTRYLGGLLVEALGSPGEFGRYPLVAFEITYPVGQNSWALLAPNVIRARMRLEDGAVLLGELAGIFQGIRTSANDIFIVRLDSTDGPIARISNALGDSAVVETDLLHPVVFGSDIQRYQLVRPSDQMLLYPYRRGVVLSEAELMSSYPNTFAYLAAYRDLLASRTSMTNLRWYELGRKRDESWLASSKLLTRDLASRTSFALDDEGYVFLVGGTAVVPADPQVALPLLGYLNSAVANDYLAALTPQFRSSFQKFEPQHLQRLPVPRFISELEDTALDLGLMAQEALVAWTTGQEDKGREVEARIDSLLTQMLGLDRTGSTQPSLA
jgi:SAM-dependent methyltransferase